MTKGYAKSIGKKEKTIADNLYKNVKRIKPLPNTDHVKNYSNVAIDQAEVAIELVYTTIVNRNIDISAQARSVFNEVIQMYRDAREQINER